MHPASHVLRVFVPLALAAVRLMTTSRPSWGRRTVKLVAPGSPTISARSVGRACIVPTR